jgi:hypothetical protein
MSSDIFKHITVHIQYQHFVFYEEKFWDTTALIGFKVQKRNWILATVKYLNMWRGEGIFLFHVLYQSDFKCISVHFPAVWIMSYWNSDHYLCHTLIQIEICWEIVVKLLNIKCHENSFSRSQVVICEQKDTQWS